jgi:integrase
LTVHLIGHFGDLLPSEITLGTIQGYAAEKIADRDRRRHAITKWETAPKRTRGRRPSPGLSNKSIEKTIMLLSQVLDDAVDAGWIEANPARGRRRRLKTAKPRRTWLERDEADALLQSAGRNRALLAVMMLGGLRVGEACALRWRSVDLARGRLTVEAGKTEAASRTLTMNASLADELRAHRAKHPDASPSSLVFATSKGTPQNRWNVARRVLAPAVKRANQLLETEGKPPMTGVTCHSLRRTFASLAYAGGATPAEVMDAMGHTDPSLALAIYAKAVRTKGGIGARIDAAMIDDDLRGTVDAV